MPGFSGQVSLPEGDLAGLPRRIVLTGFMGAGKSTVGRLLAERLERQFVDVDLVIEAELGMTVAEVFSRHGEAWFREREHQTIQRLMADENGTAGALVVALGGGALEEDRTSLLLFDAGADQVITIFLDASISTVLERCGEVDPSRPLLRDRVDLEARYRKRLPRYSRAHHRIVVDDLAPQAVVDALLAGLRER